MTARRALEYERIGRKNDSTERGKLCSIWHAEGGNKIRRCRDGCAAQQNHAYDFIVIELGCQMQRLLAPL